jgi:stearoyl-CoA desaturase (delta-9 desaturase)
MTSSALLRFDGGRNNQPGQNRLNWEITPILVSFHVAAVVALFFSWRGLFVAIFSYWITGGLGLGICFHRLLTHRSFTTPK